MPELRKDPLVGRWIIIATERARRPGNFVDPDRNVFEPNTPEAPCPFCHNQEKEIYTVQGSGGWKVKVVENGTAIVRLKEKFQRRGQGLYDVTDGYGVHDVVIETPEHVANMADLSIDQIRTVMETYALRFKEVEKIDGLQYIMAYKNYGWAAGSRRIGHARSQILGLPANPLRVKEKLTGAKRYFDYRERCLYCDMLRQESKFKKRVVVETQYFIAITPFAPRFPFEVWILPKKHHCDFAYGVVGQEQDLAIILKEILLRFKVGLDDPAYNYVLQTAPMRKKGKKTGRWRTIEEDYHWHLEVMPRLTRAAGFEKGTGFYICAIPPEDTAAFLREVKI